VRPGLSEGWFEMTIIHFLNAISNAPAAVILDPGTRSRQKYMVIMVWRHKHFAASWRRTERKGKDSRTEQWGQWC
jgi:hypothetical protein